MNFCRVLHGPVHIREFAARPLEPPGPVITAEKKRGSRGAPLMRSSCSSYSVSTGTVFTAPNFCLTNILFRSGVNALPMSIE